MTTQAYVAHDSRIRLVFLGLGSIGFVAIGLWMAGMFGEPPVGRRSPEMVRFIGWAAVVLFGFFAFVIAQRLRRVGEAFRIDADGITHAQMVKQRFSWEEITAIQPVKISGQPMIAYDVVEERIVQMGGLRARLASANRSMTGCAFSLAFAGTDAKMPEVIAAIEHFAPEHLLTQG